MNLDYGDGHLPCTLCHRERELTDLARVYVDDEFFLVCHGFTDPSPTCYEAYNAGRRRFGRSMHGRPIREKTA